MSDHSKPIEAFLRWLATEEQFPNWWLASSWEITAIVQQNEVDSAQISLLVKAALAARKESMKQARSLLIELLRPTELMGADQATALALAGVATSFTDDIGDRWDYHRTPRMVNNKPFHWVRSIADDSEGRLANAPARWVWMLHEQSRYTITKGES